MKAQQRGDNAGTVAARHQHLELIKRLDARCKLEVLRRGEQTRVLS